jgi:hypothetical protein
MQLCDHGGIVFDSLKVWKPPILELPDDLEPMRPQLVELTRQGCAARVSRQIFLRKQLPGLKIERDQQITPLDAELDEAKIAHAELQRQCEVARLRERDLSMKRLGVSLDFQLRIESLEAEIRALAPAVIDDAIGELLKLSDETRLKADLREARSEPDWVGNRKVIFSGNITAIESRMSAIGNAIIAARALKLAALPVDEIVDQLGEIMRSLPAISETTEAFDLGATSEWRRLSA